MELLDRKKFKQQLTREEGESRKLYKDSVGKWTIGIGHNIQDKGISLAVEDLMFEEDIAEALQALDLNIPWWRTLNEVRQRVLADMCFNMGWTTLSTFRNTLGLIHNGNYAEAADAMAKSLWDSQVGVRADRLEQMMRTGVDI